MYIRFFLPSLLQSIWSSIDLSHSIRWRSNFFFHPFPRLDFFFHRYKERGEWKSSGSRTVTYSSSRKCGGGVCRYGLLYQGTRDWFTELWRVKTFSWLLPPLTNSKNVVWPRSYIVAADMIMWHISAFSFFLRSRNSGISSFIHLYLYIYIYIYIYSFVISIRQ